MCSDEESVNNRAAGRAGESDRRFRGELERAPVVRERLDGEDHQSRPDQGETGPRLVSATRSL